MVRRTRKILTRKIWILNACNKGLDSVGLQYIKV